MRQVLPHAGEVLVKTVVGGIDVVAGRNDIGLRVAIEGGAAGGELGDMSRLVGGKGDKVVVRLSVNVDKGVLVPRGACGDNAGQHGRPGDGVALLGETILRHTVDVEEGTVGDVAIHVGGAVAGEQHCGAAEQQVDGVGHGAVDVVDVPTGVLKVEGHHVEMHITKVRRGDGEMVADGQDAVGVEGNGALDAAAHEAHTHEIEAHILVAGSDKVDVDNLAAVEAVLDAGARLVVVGSLLEVARAGTVVAGRRDDDAARPRQCLHGFAFEHALGGEDDALAAAEVDHTGFACFLCLVKDFLEAQHGDGRGVLVGIGELHAVGVEVHQVDVGLGSHSLILPLHRRASHDASHMGAVDAVAGVERMLLGGNLAGALQRVAEGAVGVGPMEVVVIADAQVAVSITEGGMREVEVAVEDARHHASARVGLGKARAGIETCGVHLLWCDVHLRTRHALCLEALDGVVVRQRNHLAERNAHDIDASNAVNHAALVPLEESRRVAGNGEGGESADALLTVLGR